jgi:hypothetical protein
MALGAAPGGILQMVVARVVVVVLVGTAAGVGGALAAARVVRSLLHGIDAHDPTTFAVTVVLLAGVSGIAAYVPDAVYFWWSRRKCNDRTDAGRTVARDPVDAAVDSRLQGPRSISGATLGDTLESLRSWRRLSRAPISFLPRNQMIT